MSKQRAIWTFSRGAACFGFTPIFSKVGFLAGYSLGQIISAQMLIASAVLWLLTVCRKRDWSGATPIAMAKLTASGALARLTSVFYYASLQYLPSFAKRIEYDIRRVGIAGRGDHGSNRFLRTDLFDAMGRRSVDSLRDLFGSVERLVERSQSLRSEP